MIFITGDTHIPIDIHKLNTDNFPIQKELTKNDYLIICGDFGAVWNDGSNRKEDLYWQHWLDNKNFTTLFVDGNHENHNLLNEYPIDIWNGGKIHYIKPTVIHLMRGQVYEINNTKIFTMGGAESHDKNSRIENKSWWKNEIPNEQELSEGIINLKKHNNKVNLIITHCCPTSILNNINYNFKPDILTDYLETIKQTIKYNRWYFGHYHNDKNVDIKHRCLYYDIISYNK